MGWNHGSTTRKGANMVEEFMEGGSKEIREKEQGKSQGSVLLHPMGVEPAYQLAGQSFLVCLPVGSQKRLSISLKCHWAGESSGGHLSTHLLGVGLKASTDSESVGISALLSTWCIFTLQRAFNCLETLFVHLNWVG